MQWKVVHNVQHGRFQTYGDDKDTESFNIVTKVEIEGIQAENHFSSIDKEINTSSLQCS